MSVLAAQAIWCQWSVADRLALIARWQARQSVDVRAELASLHEQAPASVNKTISTLPDGRRQISAMGPVGVVELQSEQSVVPANLLVHLAWACALGNAVSLDCEDDAVQESVTALSQMLKAADSRLEHLLCRSVNAIDLRSVRRQVCAEPLNLVVAPSADLPSLIKDALHAGRVSGAVLRVNHALHHEVGLRLPNARVIEDLAGLDNEHQVGSVMLLACGNVLEQLQQLYSDGKRNVALYSGDWAEVEAACDVAASRGESLAINTVGASPLGLFEARALYQRASLSVVARVSV